MPVWHNRSLNKFENSSVRNCNHECPQRRSHANSGKARLTFEGHLQEQREKAENSHVANFIKLKKIPHIHVGQIFTWREVQTCNDDCPKNGPYRMP